MNTGDIDSFDDPALKAAVRKAWQGESAPELLRRQVMTLAKPTGRPAPRFRIAFRPMLAAAVLVLGISAVVFQVVSLRSTTQPWLERHMMSASLISELAGHHDSFATTSNQNAGADRDPTRSAAKLGASIHLPVLAASPGKEFEFEGATTFDVGSSINAAQQFFKHGTDSVSIFTLPASVIPGAAKGTLYAGGDPDHPMSAFVQNGAFYCVMATGPNLASCRGSVATIAGDLQVGKAAPNR